MSRQKISAQQIDKKIAVLESERVKIQTKIASLMRQRAQIRHEEPLIEARQRNHRNVRRSEFANRIIAAGLKKNSLHYSNIIEAAREKHKSEGRVLAIKYLRQVTNCGLREAKEVVDRF